MSAFEPSATFKGLWIPACILFDDELPLAQKIILAEVYQLQHSKGGECFASNGHFSKLTGIKERRVRDHFSELEVAGFLTRITPMQGRTIAVAPFIVNAIKNDRREPVSVLATRPPKTAEQTEAQPTAIDAQPNADESKALGGSDEGRQIPAVARQNSTVSDGHYAQGSPYCGHPSPPETLPVAVSDRGPGNKNGVAAMECPAPRQPVATEYTMREQLQDTTEQTITRLDKRKRTVVRQALDCSVLKNDAGTHIVNGDGLTLITTETWDAWVELQLTWPGNTYASSWLRDIADMVREGIDADAMIKELTRRDSYMLYVIPDLVPDHLREKYAPAESEEGDDWPW